VVTAWSAGPAAQHLPPSPEARLRGALASLGRGLEVPTRALLDELRGFRLFDWQGDPFARGAYSYCPPGGLHLPETLAAPVADTLFFAGEATHTSGHTGTVHGALETGARAAAEILRAL
jgi:monoamine oxidase